MSHHEWGWMVVVYLFLGGLGAGSMVLSGVAHLVRRQRYEGVARAGALLAPILVGAGSGLLVFDLGQPLRFWRLFVTLNPVSPMSIGSWLLMLFSLVSAVYALLYVPTAWLEALAARTKRGAAALRRLAEWNRTPENGEGRLVFPDSPPRVAGLRSLLAIVGVPLGLGVGIYTGVLLGAIPARPFWNTPMVAQLFLFSALSTASALLLLVAPRMRRAKGDDGELERLALVRADLLFIFLELFIVIPFIVHGKLSVLSAKEALGMVMGGPYTTVFWGGVVALGILLPLVLEVMDVSGALRRLPRAITRLVHVAAPLLILVGGYLLRWVFVHAGQETNFL